VRYCSMILHIKARFDRLAVSRPNVGNLAVFQAGWPLDFWVGRLAFFGRFLKVVWTKLFLLAVFENMSIF